MERVVIDDRNFHADHLMNVLQQAVAELITHRHGSPFGAGASGAADAVHVTVRLFRQVVVNHQRNAFHVDTARSDVRCHQHTDAAGAEVRQSALAGGL